MSQLGVIFLACKMFSEFSGFVCTLHCCIHSCEDFLLMIFWLILKYMLVYVVIRKFRGERVVSPTNEDV